MGYWGVVMQDLGYELPRISIPRTPVNKGSRKLDDQQLQEELLHAEPWMEEKQQLYDSEHASTRTALWRVNPASQTPRWVAHANAPTTARTFL